MPERTVLECDRTGARAISADVQRVRVVVQIVPEGDDGSGGEYACWVCLVDCVKMLSGVSRDNLKRVIESALKPPVRRKQLDPQLSLPGIEEPEVFNDEQQRQRIRAEWYTLTGDHLAAAVQALGVPIPARMDQIASAINSASPAVLELIGNILAGIVEEAAE